MVLIQFCVIKQAAFHTLATKDSSCVYTFPGNVRAPHDYYFGS